VKRLWHKKSRGLDQSDPQNRVGEIDSGALSFDELGYLSANPDVAREVATGSFESGFLHYSLYGKSEGRPLEPVVVEHRNRELALRYLKRDGRGVEIGPSHNPIAPKSGGFDVEIVDHLDRDGLVAKYLTHGIDLRRIEEVDHVWHGEPLTELTGHSRYYDWVLASHVLEHVPDPVTFLRDVGEMVKPDGVISLVVPHKGRCFDYFLPITTTGALLDAWLRRPTRPSPGQIFDHTSSASLLDGALSWDAEESRHPNSLAHTLLDAHELFEQQQNGTDYVDVHCWRFTPASLRLVLSDLFKMGIIHLEIQAIDDEGESEFYVALRPAVDSGTQGGRSDLESTDRLELLESVAAERLL
jgi:SAM-dependent methyltransferase